jgi:CheY-like chemotaxis protein
MASVVIIGGELAIADGAALALRQSGHDVETACTASALAALVTRRPGVVVLLKPMSLPDGLMALEALRRRAGLLDLAGIVVSTSPTADQVARGGWVRRWQLVDAAACCPEALAVAVEDLTRVR